MFSEIATESFIKGCVTQLTEELQKYQDNPEVCGALKRLGRWMLTQFEWNTPDWAEEYKRLFEE